MPRGFGVAGALNNEIVRQLAAAAESAGFATFWANDTPGGDGLESLAVAARVTVSVRLGVGVIPIDRKPALEIIEQVKRLELPEDRLTVGIGAGGLRKGSVEAVRDAAIELKKHLNARVLVGALGPKMTALGGEVADGALLNWLTPEYAAKSAEIVRSAAIAAGQSQTHVATYVRVALGQDALNVLKAEADRYGSYRQYANNFARMGVSAFKTTVYCDEPEGLDPLLSKFEPELEEVVVRAICAEETADAYLELLHATSPR
jgi:alkanesulfonate monooxygenase SsuD/methylene tetrahydromethanopterin reductase-like flavin-dependent oxidoreductase (luciferase family)